MHIVKLQAGVQAPKNADFIKIEPAFGEKFTLIGSALLACGDGQQSQSVSIIGSKMYDTYEQADNAGLAWAAGHCVKQLHVERS